MRVSSRRNLRMCLLFQSCFSPLVWIGVSSKQFVNQFIIGDNPPQISHRHVIVTARKPGNKCYYKSKVQTLDASHSGTLETAANGTEFSLQSFLKIGKFLNFRNANLRKFREESQMEQKFPVRNLKRKLGIAREVILFTGNSGRCCSIRHWEFPETQTGSFGQMGNRPLFPELFIMTKKAILVPRAT